MDQKNIVRMTIDIDKDSHKQLKAITAILGKSMREVFLEAVKEYINKNGALDGIGINAKNFDPLKDVVQ